MAQPKTPPLSVRISPALLALVDQAAKDAECSRHALIIRAIEEWTGKAKPSAPVAVAKPVVSAAAAAPKASPARPAFQSRLKGEWKAP